MTLLLVNRHMEVRNVHPLAISALATGPAKQMRHVPQSSQDNKRPRGTAAVSLYFSSAELSHLEVAFGAVPKCVRRCALDPLPFFLSPVTVATVLHARGQVRGSIPETVSE